MYNSNQSPPVSTRQDDAGFKTPRIVGSTSRAQHDGNDTSRVAIVSAYTLQRQPATQFRQLSPDADITIDATSVPTATGASVGGLTQPAGLNGDLARYQTGHSGFESGGGTYNGCSVQSSFGLDRHSFDDELHHAMGTSGRGSGYTSDFTSTYRQLTAPHGDSDQNRMSALSGNHWMETQNHYSMQHTFPRCTSTGSMSSCNSHVEAMQRAADNIIREKDSIIEWQKRQLESVQSIPLTGNRLDQAVSSRIQELQYENASLKAKLTELITAKKCDKQLFDRKLGATEFELRELKLSIDSKLQLKEDSIQLLEKEIKEKDELVNALRSEMKSLKENNDVVSKELASMKRYVVDLPTAEQNADNVQTIKKLKEERQKAENEIVRLEKKVADAAKGMQSRDQLIETLQDSCSRLKSEIEQITKQNTELEAKLAADKDLSLIQQLQSDKERLKADCHKAKKLLEVKQSQMQQQQLSLTQQIKSLNERIEQESATVSSLQRALDDKELQLKQTTQSFNELTAEHQRLTERSLHVEDQLRDLQQQQNFTDLARLERQLVGELTVCVADLQSLVDVCTQCANNEEPNLAALLGVRQMTSSSATVADDTQRSNAVKYQLSKVKDLRLQIDGLRSLVSDKFAEEMGRRLTCIQQ